ncbi:hypothetical protein JCM8097_000854 [Rhodosporidiobolus ruineniae]
MSSYLRSSLSWLMPRSMISETFFPPDSKFDAERDIPNLSGKVALVTGANTGVGFETAKQLVLKDAKVYVGARSEERARSAIEQLEEAVKEKGAHGEAVWLKLDLADLDSVKAAAEEFKRKEKKVDLLFCNAGVMTPPLDMITKQGYDGQWGTNVIGHYLLCVLLLPSLRSSFQATGVKPCVVTTSSAGHQLAPGKTGLEWATMRAGPERDEHVKKWGIGTVGPLTLYGQSKLGNVMVANLLQQQHGDFLVSMSCHPGLLASELGRHVTGFLVKFYGLTTHPVWKGALTQLWGATSPEGADFGGKYLVPWARIGQADKRSDNPETLAQLDEYLKKEVKPWTA